MPADIDLSQTDTLHGTQELWISNILDDIIDLSIKHVDIRYVEAFKELNLIRKINQCSNELYEDKGDSFILSKYCDWVKKNPHRIEEVVGDVDLTIAPKKYLGNALRLLQHISEVIPNYKLPSDYVDRLWDILGSSSCDRETRTIAGGLLLEDCSGGQVQDRKEEVINKVLELYSELDDLTQVEDPFLKNLVDKHKNDDFLSEEQVDSINKILETLENTSNQKAETDAKNVDVKETDEKEVEYEEIIDPTAKKSEYVFKEFLTKNPEYSQEQDPELFDQNPLYQTYQKVEEKFKGESSLHNNTEENFKPICKWNREDVSAWSQKVKDQSIAKNPEFLPELIAVIKQANVLSSEGQFFRIPQVLSLVAFLNDPSKGMLQEIKTGEGKSTITAALAVIQCLIGHKVDIVTSIPDLAKRDAESKEKFFGMFGLSVAFNSSQESRDKGVKSCYKADIVYGDTSAFQYDWIHSIFENNVRGKRPYDIIIVDEVDSMCIDEMSKLAMVSSGIPGGEFLYTVYCAVWKHLNFLLQCTEFREEDHKYYFNPTKYKVQGREIDIDDPKQFEEKHEDIEAFYRSQLFGLLQGIFGEFDLFSIPYHLITWHCTLKDS